MKYIYFDESGDISNNLTRKFFVATFLVVSDGAELQRVIKKALFYLNRSQKKKITGTLHAYKEKPLVRKTVLKRLAQKNVKIYSMRVDKTKMPASLRRMNQHERYNYVIKQLLQKLKIKQKTTIIISRKETSKRLQNKLKKTLEDGRVSVEIAPAQTDTCLQLADFVSWSFYRKYERSDGDYIEIIRDKIGGEYEL